MTTWTTPRPATPDEKIGSLRRGILWTAGVVQLTFVVLYALIIAAGEGEKNGEPFHDFGVALGVDHALGQLTSIWLLVDFALIIGAVTVFYSLKAKWKR